MIRVIAISLLCGFLAACAAPVCDTADGVPDGGIGGTGGCATVPAPPA